MVALLARDNGVAPTCSDFATSSDPFPKAADGTAPTPPPWADPARSGTWESNVRRLGEFFRTTLADAVQSGAGRTGADDETGDYYPVGLSADSLRPGTIFADPYGHVLVVVQRIPQTPGAGGVLLAVDGQPDATVARKRFWRGNFLFAVDPALGGAGFQLPVRSCTTRSRASGAADLNAGTARPDRPSNTPPASKASTTRWTTSSPPRRSTLPRPSSRQSTRSRSR